MQPDEIPSYDELLLLQLRADFEREEAEADLALEWLLDEIEWRREESEEIQRKAWP